MNGKIMFTLTLVMMQVLICRSASVVPTQVGEIVSTPSAQLQQGCEQPAEAITGSAKRQTSEVAASLPNTSVRAPNQHVDTIISLTEKYLPRQTATTKDLQSTLSNQADKATSTLPVGDAATMASKYTNYATRQLPEETQAPNVTTQVSQTASSLTNQAGAGNIDPAALTQTVFRTLEENFGRMGTLLFDLITSREGLGEDFVPIAAYAAQRLGTDNIRNAVNTVLNLVSQVDWYSRAQSLFSRIGDVRDNRTGMTLQDVFQVVRNIFDDPRTFDELRQRISNGTNQTVSAAVNVVDASATMNEAQRQTRSRYSRGSLYNYY